jgi:hypothetical protein
VHDRVDSVEEPGIGAAVGVEQVRGGDAFDPPAGAVLGPGVDQRQVESLPERRQHLAGDVARRTGYQDPLGCQSRLQAHSSGRQPLYSVTKSQRSSHDAATPGGKGVVEQEEQWWIWGDSNPLPLQCHKKLDDYLSFLSVRNLSDTYIEGNRVFLKGFVNTHSNPSPQSALAYLSGYTHLSQNSKARYAGYLKSFLKYLGYDFDLSIKRPIFYLNESQMRKSVG